MLISLFFSSPVLAQGFDAHGFNLVALSGDPRDGLVVQRAGRFQQGDWFLGGAFEWAESPLLYLVDEPDGSTSVERVLDNVFALNASGGAWIFDRWRLDVAAPLYLTSAGRDGLPQGVGIGDVRVASMVSLLRPGATGFGLGLAPYLDLPTGSEETFLGEPGLSGGGSVAFGYEGSRYTLGGEAGIQVRPALELENISNADALNWGFRAGYLVSDRMSLLAEARLETPLTPSVAAFTGAPAELTLSGRGRLQNGVHGLAGGALGLDRGASAATYRLFLGGGFGRIQEQGPSVPVPAEPATLAVTVTKGGRAVDGASVDLTYRDETLSQTVDAAGWVVEVPPESEWAGKATWGACYGGEARAVAKETGEVAMPIALARIDATVTIEVVDALGNFISDAAATWQDQESGCVPTEKLLLPEGTGKQTVGIGARKLAIQAEGFGPWSGGLSLAPGDSKTLRVQLEAARVRVEQQQIVILEIVYFEYNSDVLLPASYALLDEVAATLLLHPELGRVEVAGHTDADGPEAFNLSLSQRRAARVVAYLVDKGVEARRLTPRGYGETQPIASNASAEGKQKNRRVEFTLLDRAEGVEK